MTDRVADGLAAKGIGLRAVAARPGSRAGERRAPWRAVAARTGQLLMRRSISSGELAYCIVHTRHPVPLVDLVRVVGTRWGVEETFQFAKNKTRLDHYQVRRYDARYRHITPPILAAAFLTVTVHHERIHDQKGVPVMTITT